MATSHILPLFPTAVGLYNMGEELHEMNQSLVADILSESKKDSTGIRQSNLGGWHSECGLEDKCESFSLLKENIQICVDNYCDQTFLSDSKYTCVGGIWANVNNSGDINLPHHHSGSVMTGVYYPLKEIVKGKPFYNYQKDVTLLPGSWTAEKGGGSIIFHDPAHGQKTHYNTSGVTPYNMQNYHVYPVSGLLVLFPPYLLHTVTPFKEKKTRLSISFCCRYGTN